MAIDKRSWAYNGETLVWNGTDELLWSAEIYNTACLYSSNSVFWSNSGTGTRLASGIGFEEYPYAVIGFSHSANKWPNYNDLSIVVDGAGWRLFTSGGNTYNTNQYKSVRVVRGRNGYYSAQDIKDWLFDKPSNVLSASAIINSYPFVWANVTATYGYGNNENRKFKLIIDRNSSAASAYWSNNFVGCGKLSGGKTGLDSIAMWNSDDNSDKFRISNVGVYGARTFEDATGINI